MKKILTSIFIASCLVGCSTQKDSFKNRQYHKMTSWFNGVFNAEEDLTKQIREEKTAYENYYGGILPIGSDYFTPEENTKVNSEASKFASGPRQNSSNQNSVVTPTGYQAVETRASRVIEKHSMLLKGEERNSMIGRAYLLIGKARFYQGNYFESLDAFNYVIKGMKDTSYADEANVYAIIAEIEGGNVYDGQERLVELYEKDAYGKPLKVIVAKNYAQLLIDHKKYEEAVEPLQKAIYFSKDSDEESRLYFTLGQVYSKLGKQQEAGEAFTKVFKMKPGPDMEVKAQLAIAANFDKEQNSYDNYKGHLLDIANKGFYVSKKNELYYGVAEMAYRSGNFEDAIKYSQLSLKEPESDPYIRAKAYENFANIQFTQNNYLYATAYYDSAVTSFTKDTDKKRIETKNTALKKLMEKHYLVQKNDSILRIAKLSPDEQSTFFSTYIAKIKKAEEERVIEEQKEMADFQIGGKTSSFASGFADGNTNKFYFYNNNQKSNGQSEFQRIWGSISLKDNWRSGIGMNNAIEAKELELTGGFSTGDPRRFELDYYLEKIPTQAAELDRLKIERDTAQLSLGIGYFDTFENVTLSSKTLESLLTTPPKAKEVEAQALYQLYRIYRDRDRQKEEQYKQKILADFPNSIYAGYILNPDVEYITEETKEAIDMYKATYALYQDGKYEEVKENVRKAIVQFPTEIIVAKFGLLNAYAISKTEPQENFIMALEGVAIGYEGTEEAKQAKRLLAKLNAIKNKTPEAENTPKEVENVIDVNEEDIKPIENNPLNQSLKGRTKREER